MKKLLFLFMILGLGLGSCQKDDSLKSDPDDSSSLDFDPFVGYSDTESVIIVNTTMSVLDNKNYSYEHNEYFTLVIWDLFNKELEITNSEDILKGIAIDKETKEKVITSNIFRDGIGFSLQGYGAGRYLIAVVLSDKAKYGKNAFSYKVIDIKENSKVYMNKVFTDKTKDFEYKAWTSNIIQK